MFALMGQCKLTKVEFKYLGQVTCLLILETSNSFLGDHTLRTISANKRFLILILITDTFIIYIDEE